MDDFEYCKLVRDELFERGFNHGFIFLATSYAWFSLNNFDIRVGNNTVVVCKVYKFLARFNMDDPNLIDEIVKVLTHYE